MKGIILAAGRGSRLAPITDKQPKCFTVLKGKSLLDWQLLALRSAGVEDVAVVTGYRSEAFQHKLTYFRNCLWSASNMVTSLQCASAWLERDTCIISYADIVYSADVVRSLLENRGDICISYDPNWLELWKKRFEEPLDDAESFRTNDGLLLEIGMESTCLDEIEGQYMGLIKITTDGWSQMSDYLNRIPMHKQVRLDMTGLLQGMLVQGASIHTLAINDHWFEVDSIDDLICYENLDISMFPSTQRQVWRS